MNHEVMHPTTDHSLAGAPGRLDLRHQSNGFHVDARLRPRPPRQYGGAILKVSS